MDGYEGRREGVQRRQTLCWLAGVSKNGIGGWRLFAGLGADGLGNLRTHWTLGQRAQRASQAVGRWTFVKLVFPSNELALAPL